jgi:hypothetical protein
MAQVLQPKPGNGPFQGPSQGHPHVLPGGPQQGPLPNFDSPQIVDMRSVDALHVKEPPVRSEFLSLEGYTFRLPEQSRTKKIDTGDKWKTVVRSKLPFAEREFQMMVRDQENAGQSINERYALLSPNRCSQIDKLIADRNMEERDPFSAWRLVYLALKRANKRSMEVVAMTAILARERSNSARPGAPMQPKTSPAGQGAMNGQPKMNPGAPGGLPGPGAGLGGHPNNGMKPPGGPMPNGQGMKPPGGPGAPQSAFAPPKQNGGKSNAGMLPRGPLPGPNGNGGPPPGMGRGPAPVSPRGPGPQGGSPMGAHFPHQNGPRVQGMPLQHLNAWVNGQQQSLDESSDDDDDDYSTNPSSTGSFDDYKRRYMHRRRESAPVLSHMFYQNDPRRPLPQIRQHRKSVPQYIDDQVEYIIDGNLDDRMRRMRIDDTRPRQQHAIARRVQRGSVHVDAPIQFSSVPRNIQSSQYLDYHPVSYSRPPPVAYEDEVPLAYRRESNVRMQPAPAGRFDRVIY